MRAVFVSSEWENNAHTIISFYFKPDSLYRYVAGQYAVITVPHANPDSRGESRTMTLSSSPGDDLLKITLKVFNADGSSYKRALQALRPGDAVTIYDAMGDLVLPLDVSIPLVFVAGGIGIASYVGMVKWLLDTHDNRDVTLLYSVARPEDIVLQTVFDSYGSQHGLTKILFMTNLNSSVAPGKFTGEVAPRRLSASDVIRHTTADSLVYISGSETMVDSLRSDLAASGFSNQRIIFDYFEGYTEQ
jgi:ferredoxin-NADP reductase